MGFFDKIVGKFSGNKENDPSIRFQDSDENYGDQRICIRYVQPKNVEDSQKVYEEIAKEEDKTLVFLMNYDQKEQIRASENVSWLYDVDHSLLNKTNIYVYAVGKRCYDYKVRCLLAGIPEERINTELMMDQLKLSENTKEFSKVYFVTSYTSHIAMEHVKEQWIRK